MSFFFFFFFFNFYLRNYIDNKLDLFIDPFHDNRLKSNYYNKKNSGEISNKFTSKQILIICVDFLFNFIKLIIYFFFFFFFFLCFILIRL
jgi:hypothetical protein